MDFTTLNSDLNWLIVPLCEIFFHLFNQFGGIIFFLEVYTRVPRAPEKPQQSVFVHTW